MIYKIFTGVDYGAISVKGNSIFEVLSFKSKSENLALIEYDKIKQKLKEESKLEQNKYRRLYCYLLYVYEEEHLWGIHHEDNGLNSITMYANSYTQYKESETYNNIRNIEKGKETTWIH